MILRGLKKWCSCAYESYCLSSVDVYMNSSNNTIWKEKDDNLPMGCSALSGFRSSKMTWWYNQSYIDDLQATYALAISSLPKPTVEALSTETYVNYGRQRMWWMLDRMFSYDQNSISAPFETFYNYCAPASCSFTIARRRDLLVAVILLISVCGGFNKGLRLLVPAFVFFINWLNKKWQDRKRMAGKTSATLSSMKPEVAQIVSG